MLGATFATGNLGVSALTAGIIKSIRMAYPDANIVLLDYGREHLTYSLTFCNRNIHISQINMRYSKNIFVPNHIIRLLLLAFLAKMLPLKHVRVWMCSRNQPLRVLCNSDIVAAVSGGDSFSDVYGINRFFYVSLPQILTLLLKRDLILLPQTIGPFKHRLVKIAANYIINRAAFADSRDYAGLKELQALRRNRDSALTRFCYDVGFVIDATKPAKLDVGDLFDNLTPDNVVVGFNISGLLYMGGYNHNNMFGLVVLLLLRMQQALGQSNDREKRHQVLCCVLDSMLYHNTYNVHT